MMIIIIVIIQIMIIIIIIIIIRRLNNSKRAKPVHNIHTLVKKKTPRRTCLTNIHFLSMTVCLLHW